MNNKIFTVLKALSKGSATPIYVGAADENTNNIDVPNFLNGYVSLVPFKLDEKFMLTASYTMIDKKGEYYIESTSLRETNKSGWSHDLLVGAMWHKKLFDHRVNLYYISNILTPNATLCRWGEYSYSLKELSKLAKLYLQDVEKYKEYLSCTSELQLSAVGCPYKYQSLILSVNR